MLRSLVACALAAAFIIGCGRSADDPNSCTGAVSREAGCSAYCEAFHDEGGVPDYECEFGDREALLACDCI